jgi:hypothetical protein
MELPHLSEQTRTTRKIYFRRKWANLAREMNFEVLNIINIITEMAK